MQLWFNPIPLILNTSYVKISILVGGFNPSEKYEFVSWAYDIPN